jgi:hypothetical protein
MQNRLIALHIVVDVGAREVLLRLSWPRNRHRPPGSVADPGALLLAGVANVVQAYWLAALFKLIFNLTGKRKRLRAGHVYATILQFAAIEHGNGDETAARWLACFANPFEHRDRPQLWGILAGLCNLTWVLRECRQRGQQADHGQDTASNQDPTCPVR